MEVASMAKIKKISSHGEYIFFDLEGYINGREILYGLTVKTKGFFVGTSEIENNLYITSSNLTEMPQWDRYKATLIYTTTSMQENLEELCEFQVEGLYKMACNNKNDLIGSSYNNVLNDKNDFLNLIKEYEGDFSNNKGFVLLNITRVSSL